MSPGAHLLISWLSAASILKEHRERKLVALAGVAPDADGLGIVVDKITGTTHYYFDYHHYLGHSIFSAFFIACLASVIARKQKAMVGLMAFLMVHVHILCDIAGSKGPDGYQWPIYYFYPVLPELGLTWQYQWELNAWPNIVIMLCLLSLCGYYAVTKHVSFFEVFGKRFDAEAFNMYRKYILRKN